LAKQTDDNLSQIAIFMKVFCRQGIVADSTDIQAGFFMYIMGKRFLFFFFLPLLLSCTPTSYQSEDSSGFLSDYSNLQPIGDPAITNVWRWQAPDFSSSNYENIILLPIRFHPVPVEKNSVNATALENILIASNNVLLNTAKKTKLPLSLEKGPTTLLLRTAITAVSVELKSLAVREVIPVRLIFSGVEMALGKRDKTFTLLFEYELVDSVSGSVVLRGIRQDTGNPLINDKDKLSIDHAKPILERLVGDLEHELAVLSSALNSHHD